MMTILLGRPADNRSGTRVPRCERATDRRGCNRRGEYDYVLSVHCGVGLRLVRRLGANSEDSGDEPRWTMLSRVDVRMNCVLLLM